MGCLVAEILAEGGRGMDDFLAEKKISSHITHSISSFLSTFGPKLLEFVLISPLRWPAMLEWLAWEAKN